MTIYDEDRIVLDVYNQEDLEVEHLAITKSVI
jgi:hypothetical protein